MPSRRNRSSSPISNRSPASQQVEPFSKIVFFIAETRRIWLHARSQNDIFVVVCRYRAVIRFVKAILGQQHHQQQNRQDVPLTEEEQYQLSSLLASSRRALGLIYLQRGEMDRARPILVRLGCIARLSSHIFRYPTLCEREDRDSSLAQQQQLQPSNLCYYVDDVLPKTILRRFRDEVFGPPDASYWKDHNYSVDPPSPYFSYVVNIAEKKKVSPSSSLKQESVTNSVPLINAALSAIISAAALKIDNLAADAKFVEIWAHNRPAHGPASQHGLHYDSEDEGRDGIRNPLATVVFFVAAPDAECGGPTLVIDQRMTDSKLGASGCLAAPKENRCVFFTSNLLHGVIPGRFFGSRDVSRRVTLMFAFWKEIPVRDLKTIGSARPFPTPTASSPVWVKQLTEPWTESAEDRPVLPMTASRLQTAARIAPVYERVSDDKPWPRNAALLAYEQVFQGV